MTYDAVDFVLQYEELLDKIIEITHPQMYEMHMLIFRFRFLDPHEFIEPDMTFGSFNMMIEHLGRIIWDEYTDYGHSLNN